MQSDQKFYITTSIAYVNSKPHIGYAMEILQADVLARYHRLFGKDVFYQTGTDEHGNKIVEAAKEAGLSVKELVDQNAGVFKELTLKLQISNDAFVRTTDLAHEKYVQEFWMKMFEKGDIYLGKYEGLYCIGCEKFILEKELVDGLCSLHNKPPIKINEENYFFRLSKYSDLIKQKIESGELKIIPENRKKEILNVLEEGLTDVSFSRSKKALEWGIEVPNDPSQVMYVWCDALTNYISTIDFERYWPANVQLVGKDILRFHAAIWIGMLMSVEMPLPKALYVHGFITSEGKKMSKSLNNVVDPFEVIEQYGVDPVRYYLLREIPTLDDGDFSKFRFETVYNDELANTIGNLVSRVISMAGKYFEGKVPEPGEIRSVTSDGKFFDELVQESWTTYDQAIENFDLKKALETILIVAYASNKYVEDTKPWALAKENTEELKKVIYTLLELIRQIALMLLPFLPTTAEKILKLLIPEFTFPVTNVQELRSWKKLKAGQKLAQSEVLFPRLHIAPLASLPVD